VIAEATAAQPAARLALEAAAREPFHAYLLAGPRGSGKAAAARALAAELLAAGAPDPADARRRALADPSPHPDLVWLRPPGTQHLVDAVRENVIAQVAYRPFEGERRVFVIESAEAMAEESQNALLKTLEEPPPFAHILLVSAEPEALLETVRSRCRLVRFTRLGPEAVEARLAGHEPGDERRAAARLSAGDSGRAAFLLSEEGRELRAAVERLARAVRTGALAEAPWEALAQAADAAGEREGAAVRAAAA
jgi:DNA polymerase III subunit delta'